MMNILNNLNLAKEAAIAAGKILLSDKKDVRSKE